MARTGKILALLIFTSGLVLSGNPPAVAETYYRWIDDRGNPVHSDRPPAEGVDYEVVSTDSSLVRPVEAGKGAVPKKVTPTASNDFKPVETAEAMVEKNPEYCQRAQDNIWILDHHARNRMRNDQGEMVFLDEDQKALQRQQSMDAIEAYCD